MDVAHSHRSVPPVLPHVRRLTPAPPPATRSRDEAWALVAPLRGRLIAVGRARGLSPEDAQDVAHHVMCRAVERGCLDPPRVEASLVKAVLSRCHELGEEAGRHARFLARSAGDDRLAGPLEDTVCDRAEADWLLAKLPARERRCVELSVRGETVTAIAAKTGLSYPTVDRLLSRARREMRRLATPLLVVVGALWRQRRLALPPATAAVALASVSVLTWQTPVAPPAVVPEAQEVTRRVVAPPRRTVPPPGRSVPAAPPGVGTTATTVAGAAGHVAAPEREKVVVAVDGVGVRQSDEDAVERLQECLGNGVEVTLAARGGIVCATDTSVVVRGGRN